MQKLIKISCCAECPFYTELDGIIPHCDKQLERIDRNSDNFVNSALIGFPDWCPLESVTEGKIHDYKKDILKILRIMENPECLDALQEASHYLNSVVENAKETSKIN